MTREADAQAHREATAFYGGPRMTVGTPVDREIAAFVEGARWRAAQVEALIGGRRLDERAPVRDLRVAIGLPIYEDMNSPGLVAYWDQVEEGLEDRPELLEHLRAERVRKLGPKREASLPRADDWRRCQDCAGRFYEGEPVPCERHVAEREELAARGCTCPGMVAEPTPCEVHP